MKTQIGTHRDGSGVLTNVEGYDINNIEVRKNAKTRKGIKQ